MFLHHQIKISIIRKNFWQSLKKICTQGSEPSKSSENLICLWTYAMVTYWERYFEKDLSNWVEMFRICFLRKFCVLRISFPASGFSRSYAWDFKISTLKTVSYFCSFKKCKTYSRQTTAGNRSAFAGYLARGRLNNLSKNVHLAMVWI